MGLWHEGQPRVLAGAPLPTTPAIEANQTTPTTARSFAFALALKPTRGDCFLRKMTGTRNKKTSASTGSQKVPKGSHLAWSPVRYQNGWNRKNKYHSGAGTYMPSSGNGGMTGSIGTLIRMDNIKSPRKTMTKSQPAFTACLGQKG